MIINFSNIGSGSGGGSGSGVTTGQVQTMIDNSISGKQDTLVSGTNIKTINGSAITGSGNLVVQGGGSVDTGAVQSYLTAATDSAFTGLTGMKEGDIACLVSHDVVVPNTYDYDGEGWDVSFYDGEWWKDRAGYDVQLSFNAEQIISQDVLHFIQQYDTDYETDEKLEIVFDLYGDNDAWLTGFGIAVDSAGTVYGQSVETGEWEELTGSTPYTTRHIPLETIRVDVNTNNYDFSLSDPDALYVFRETGSNIHYYRQNGEWVELEKVYPTYKYVNDKFGEVGNSIWSINQSLSNHQAWIVANSTNISALSGKSQTRLGVVSTLPSGTSEGDVAILSTIDTGSVVTSALSFNDFVSLVDNGGFTPGKTFTFSADTGTSHNRMEIGVFYKISGVNHFFQIGCSNTGQWYNILNATNQNKQNWDGSLINFTVPSDATNISKYLQAGSDNHAMYIETSTYDTIQTPYMVIGGEWAEPATKAYVNNVVGDIETALASI